MTCLESGDLTGLIVLNGYLDFEKPVNFLFWIDFYPDVLTVPYLYA